MKKGTEEYKGMILYATWGECLVFYKNGGLFGRYKNIRGAKCAVTRYANECIDVTNSEKSC